MKLRYLPGYLRDLVLRMLPHRAKTGLVRIGNPGRSSPVLLTGNFTLTVRRIIEALDGHDAWLLCANSKGINVWCASSGGHLTHHDVISVIRTSRIEQEVDGRELILPQLCATGVERTKVTAVTGWKTRWGPARLEDLPGFLTRGRLVRPEERFMRFPLWERMEMAAMWGIPLVAIATPIVAAIAGGVAALAALLGTVAIVGGLFASLPALNLRGQRRWAVLALFAVTAFALSSAVLWLTGRLDTTALITVGVELLLTAAVLAVDLEGTTPWYGSFINTSGDPAHIELVEERCTGEAQCVLVCPRQVLTMNGKRRKVEITLPDQCIQCGACVVQCPTDALRFRYQSGTVVEAPTIRRTRMNMLGKRTVAVPD